jgi:hypothetical protein
MTTVQILDLLSVACALASSWFWYVASRSRVRRVSRREEPDAADLNRLVTALNRTQILNARAAMMTAAAAFLVALRFGVDVLPGH